MTYLRYFTLTTVVFIFLLACRTVGTASQAETQLDEPPVSDRFSIVRLDVAEGELSDLLQAEAQKAEQLGRRPYVEFYADWCPPCQAIRKSLGDERMIEAFEGTYIIQLDLDQWDSKLAGTGFEVRGIPVFFEIDHSGKPTGRMISGAAWGEDVPENMAPPLKAFFHSVDLKTS